VAASVCREAQGEGIFFVLGDWVSIVDRGGSRLPRCRGRAQGEKAGEKAGFPHLISH